MNALYQILNNFNIPDEIINIIIYQFKGLTHPTALCMYKRFEEFNYKKDQEEDSDFDRKMWREERIIFKREIDTYYHSYDRRDTSKISISDVIEL